MVDVEFIAHEKIRYIFSLRFKFVVVWSELVLGLTRAVAIIYLMKFTSFVSDWAVSKYIVTDHVVDSLGFDVSDAITISRKQRSSKIAALI